MKFETESKIEKLIKFVPAIFKHIKSREVFYTFYYCSVKEPLCNEN